MNNLETLSKNPDEKLLKKFFDLFNSDLSLLNQVISDIGVLKYLIENVNNISKEKFEYEIDQMKYRLGNMTNSQYLNKETTINKLLNELENDVVDIGLIDKIEDSLREVLDIETLKIMKQWGIFPIPDKYMPTLFHSNIAMPNNDETTNYSTLLINGRGVRVIGGKLSVKYLKDLLSASYDENPPEEIDDFKLDNKLSTKHVKVYHNNKNNQTVIAHRGTKEWYDWGNNLIYGIFGKAGYKLTPRFKESEKVHNEAVAKYGLKNLTTIGHSQGGIPAEILGQEGKEIITLNKATRPFGNVKGKKQYDISTTGDVVSKLNPFHRKGEKDISIKSKSYNPLKEHLLPVLEGLDDNLDIGEGVKRKRICMKKSSIIKEHKKLIPILRKGNIKQRMKEAKEQENELKHYL
jgi:hypothetical protein